MQPAPAPLQLTSAAGTYDRMAGLYDAFTAHHDYKLWLGRLLPACVEAGLSGNRVLDVGCGTGKSFLPLLDRGWEVTACDISPAMLEVASHKSGSRAALHVADARSLPRYGEFDLVLALDDVVNYLLDGSELEAFMRGVSANLAPGGVACFDANTLGSYRTFFAETSTEDREDMTLRARGLTPPDAGPRVRAEIVFEAFGPDGRPLMEPALHIQRHHPQLDVIGALDAAGLRAAAVYGHHEDAVLRSPLDELEHAKAIYVATARSEGR